MALLPQVPPLVVKVPPGHNQIYYGDALMWTQVRDDIVGETDGDYSGVAVALSADGSHVAIGAEDNGKFLGHG